MASTSNAENLVEIARIIYQLCDYTDFRADFLRTTKLARLFSRIEYGKSGDDTISTDRDRDMA